MIHHLRYAWYLARHKWHVIVAGARLGVPLWALIVHDWSKFLPDEWFPFVAWIYRDPSAPPGIFVSYGFEFACRTHYRRNPHHWQHWMTANRAGDVVADPMPELYVREMVADWIGAAKAQSNGAIATWWAERRDGIALDYRPHQLVDQLVEKASKERIG